MVTLKGVCLIHSAGMECPLVGSEKHCGEEPCHLEHDNPFIEEKVNT